MQISKISRFHQRYSETSQMCCCHCSLSFFEYIFLIISTPTMTTALPLSKASNLFSSYPVSRSCRRLLLRVYLNYRKLWRQRGKNYAARRVRDLRLELFEWIWAMRRFWNSHKMRRREARDEISILLYAAFPLLLSPVNINILYFLLHTHFTWNKINILSWAVNLLSHTNDVKVFFRSRL